MRPGATTLTRISGARSPAIWRENARIAPFAAPYGALFGWATIAAIDNDSRLRLMEWCYVVCSHERLRGRRPAAPPLAIEAEAEPIVVSLDDYREKPLGTELVPAVEQA